MGEVVVVSHVEYISGQRYDLEMLGEAAHSVGAKLVVDATQSLGVVPIIAKKSGADAIVCSGYKWLRGTFGAAVGWLCPSSLLQTVKPALVGFRSHRGMWDLDASRLDFPVNDASRWEHGSIHFGAALGLAKSIQEINMFHDAWGHVCLLTDFLVHEASTNLNIKCISPRNNAVERSAIVAFRLPHGHCAIRVARRLLEEHSILVSSRAGILRVSPHIDNTIDDIKKLLHSLSIILK